MESVSSDGERKPQPAGAGGEYREQPDGGEDGNTTRTGENEPKPETEATGGAVLNPETAAVAGSAATSSDERTWALVAHLSALAGYAIPFGNIFGPLIVWILKRETLPAVEEHGKEALNFQISVTIYMLVAVVLIVVAIGVALVLALAIFDLIFIIIAAVKAYNGESYRYPLSIRFIK